MTLALCSSRSCPLVVHSHLAWEWVWQRPQQFVSRLTKHRRALFVEPPLVEKSHRPARYSLRPAPQCPSVTLLQMTFPAARWNEGAWVDGERARLLCQALGGPLRGEFGRPIQWFYDPMAAPIFVGELNERAVVYDCMDEPSGFSFAQPELRAREAFLLERADVVFAGGRKLWEAKRPFNPNCHFVGCGVDVEHFARAQETSAPLPDDWPLAPEHAHQQVLGFFGVVDERIDLELLAFLADANPLWHIVMVGHVEAKTSAAALPRRANLHWLGARPYEQLPSYCRGFDVALMPFARNEATEYINPTKALEYLAAGKPVVSSDVPDVVSNFGGAVHIARDHAEFLAHCRACASRPDLDATARGHRLAHANTWDAVVERLEGYLCDALSSRDT